MNIPISINDLIIFMALVSVILLITSELLNPRYGYSNFVIKKKEIGKIAIVTSVLFLLIMLIKIYEIIRSGF
jgi:hypothetical protein